VNGDMKDWRREAASPALDVARDLDDRYSLMPYFIVSVVDSHLHNY